jgi:hypothetical protein
MESEGASRKTRGKWCEKRLKGDITTPFEMDFVFLDWEAYTRAFKGPKYFHGLRK